MFCLVCNPRDHILHSETEGTKRVYFMNGSLDKPPSENGPLERFVFSTASTGHARTETEGLINKYEAKIDELNREYLVGGMPLIDRILMVSRDKDELKGLATGLAKVAGFVAALDELLIRKQVLDLATKDPNFFGWAFGDFSDDSDKLVEELTSYLEQGSD
jgi:hypothetical protein